MAGGKDKGKGKALAIDQSSKPVFKKKKASVGSSRGRGSGISIREPSGEPTPLGIAQRFHSPAARKRFNKAYSSRKIIFEKPLVRKEVDPAFIAALEKMGLKELIDVPEEEVNITLVREFFANLNSEHLAAGYVWVRKKKVSFTPEAINEVYKLDVADEMLDFTDIILKEEKAGLDPLERLRVEIHEPTPWTLRPLKKEKGEEQTEKREEYKAKREERKEIATAHWPENWRVMCRFIQCRLFPKNNIGHFGIDDLEVLYALHRKLTINVGKLLYQEISGHVKITKRLIMAPYLICRLCRDAKVYEDPSDLTVQKPQGIKIDQNRVKQLVRKEVGPSSTTAGAATETDAPTLSGPRSFSKWEKIQLTIAESLQTWLNAVQSTQKRILKNQKRIAKQLELSSLRLSSTPTLWELPLGE